jgi:hypothetical protein
MVLGAVLAGCGAVAAGCGGSSTPNADTQAFVNEVHQQAPDIGTYRSDQRLIALGQAVCNDLAAGVSVSQISSLLATPDLPTPDLGAVMSVASQTLCPKYASAFSAG